MCYYVGFQFYSKCTECWSIIGSHSHNNNNNNNIGANRIFALPVYYHTLECGLVIPNMTYTYKMI